MSCIVVVVVFSISSGLMYICFLYHSLHRMFNRTLNTMNILYNLCMCMYQGLFLNTFFTSVRSLLKDLLNDYLPFKDN